MKKVMLTIFLSCFISLSFSYICPLQAGEHEQSEMTPEQQQMMKAWQEYMTPGEPHKILSQFTGEWLTETTTWMEPGSKPEMSKGTASYKMILDDHYLYGKYHGTVMGKEFKGIGITGYDNYLKKYHATWIDSMMTGLYVSWGECKDDDCKSVVFTGDMDDPITKTKMKTKQILTVVDDDKHTFEMFMIGPDGKEFKSMEMVYTRKK